MQKWILFFLLFPVTVQNIFILKDLSSIVLLTVRCENPHFVSPPSNHCIEHYYFKGSTFNHIWQYDAQMDHVCPLYPVIVQNIITVKYLLSYLTVRCRNWWIFSPLYPAIVQNTVCYSKGSTFHHTFQYDAKIDNYLGNGIWFKHL